MERVAVDRFIKDKELTFVASKDTGPFWGGVDHVNNQTFELFLTGNKESPSIEDIKKYHSLLDHFDQIIADIQEQIKTYLLNRGGEEMWKKFTDSKLELSIIGLDSEHSQGDLDILGSVKGRGWLFHKHVSFCASVTDNKVINFDIE